MFQTTNQKESRNQCSEFRKKDVMQFWSLVQLMSCGLVSQCIVQCGLVQCSVVYCRFSFVWYSVA